VAFSHEDQWDVIMKSWEERTFYALKSEIVQKTKELTNLLALYTDAVEKIDQKTWDELIAVIPTSQKTSTNLEGGESDRIKDGVWRPIETYEKPANEYDYDHPKAIFFSEKTGVVVGRCLNEGDGVFSFRYDRDELVVHPTHWMPLPPKP
jgi:hypothetical protein